MQLHTCPHCGKGCFYYENQPYHKCLRCNHYHGIMTEPEPERKERDLEAEAITIAAEMSIMRGWLYKRTVLTDAWYCVVGEFFPAGLTLGIWDYKSWEQAKAQVYPLINMTYNTKQYDWTFQEAYAKMRGEAA